MPVIQNVASTTNVTIPSNVYSMKVQLWGGSGGGEHLRISDGNNYAGSTGGDTTFIGLVAKGGGGAGIISKNSVGAGGSYQDTFNWTALGAAISGVNGNNGALNSGGTGGTGEGITGIKGGDGASQNVVYSSSVSHSFNNETNVTTFSFASNDITVQIDNQGAADGLSCGTGSNLKRYKINFNVPYDNANYTINMLSFCQQAAGGSTTGPFSYAGESNLTSSGFYSYFCRVGKNSYIACFNFQTTGQKSSLRGTGGGGSGYLVAEITRDQLISSNTYLPGQTYSFQIGSGGIRGREFNNISRANNGFTGKGKITYIIQAAVQLLANGEDLEVAIITGESANLSWSISGDADTTFLDNGIGEVPNVGNFDVFPTKTTVYTATTSGLGGTGSDTVKVIVYQKPTVQITLPISVGYGENVILEYEYQYANVGAKVTPQYKYRNANNDGFDIINGTSVNLTPLSTSAEEGAEGSLVTGEIELSPIYNDDGPFEITYFVEVEGIAGKETTSGVVSIDIDLSPDNLVIPEAVGEANQDPVFSPDPEKFPDTVLEIQDVDIPVEIKSDKPIKISLDDGNTWINVREKS